MSKTILEHFEGLPEPYRSQAIENMESQNPENGNIIVNSIFAALGQGFSWSGTPIEQGYSYWNTFYSFECISQAFDDVLKLMPQPASQQPLQATGEQEWKDAVQLAESLKTPYEIAGHLFSLQSRLSSLEQDNEKLKAIVEEKGVIELADYAKFAKVRISDLETDVQSLESQLREAKEENERLRDALDKSEAHIEHLLLGGRDL